MLLPRKENYGFDLFDDFFNIPILIKWNLFFKIRTPVKNLISFIINEMNMAIIITIRTINIQQFIAPHAEFHMLQHFFFIIDLIEISCSFSKPSVACSIFIHDDPTWSNIVVSMSPLIRDITYFVASYFNQTKLTCFITC